MAVSRECLFHAVMMELNRESTIANEDLNSIHFTSI
jgi:hypothetical protein